MNSAEAIGSRREARFYQNIKGALAHAVLSDGVVHEPGSYEGEPHVLRRMIAAEFDGPGA